MTARRIVGLRGAAGRGSISIEVAVLLPAFMLLVAMAATFGRQTVAQSQAMLAARDASRAASLSSTDTAAAAAARTAADGSLAGGACASWTTTLVEPSGFAVRPGVPATVTVTVTCVISLTDLGLIGDRTLTADFTSPLDVYRSRT